jgi:hypothetical protein
LTGGSGSGGTSSTIGPTVSFTSSTTPPTGSVTGSVTSVTGSVISVTGSVTSVAVAVAQATSVSAQAARAGAAATTREPPIARRRRARKDVPNGCSRAFELATADLIAHRPFVGPSGTRTRVAVSAC